MAEPRSKGTLGELRCFGCGQEPRAGVIARLADGSNCPSCAGRVLDEQPTLLRHSTAASRSHDRGASHATDDMLALEAEAHDAADDEHASTPLAGARRLRHLSGGTAPDMHAAPDGHWPNEPA